MLWKLIDSDCNNFLLQQKTISLTSQVDRLTQELSKKNKQIISLKDEMRELNTQIKSLQEGTEALKVLF